MSHRNLFLLFGCLAFIHFAELSNFIHSRFLGDSTLDSLMNYTEAYPKSIIFAEKEFQPIRITPDYSLVSEYLSALENLYIKSVLIPAMVNYWEKVIKVAPVPGNYKANNTICAGLPIPEQYVTDVVDDTDLLLLVMTVPSLGGATLAAAAPCVFDAASNRPLIGVIIIGETSLDLSVDKFQNQLITVLHEFTHVLGFTSWVYNYYIDPVTMKTLSNVTQNATMRGVDTVIITLPGVVEYAREYFGCSSLTGVELENQGDPGTQGGHWERRILGDEYMTGSNLLLGKISNFTLLLLNGTGWYQVNFTYAEPLLWGKGKGCSFIYEDCVDPSTMLGEFEEFCYESPMRGEESAIERCSRDRKFVVPCYINHGTPQYSVWDYFGIDGIAADGLSDNCPYPLIAPELNPPMCSNGQQSSDKVVEVYGNNSLCFEGSLVGDATPYYEYTVLYDQFFDAAYCLNYQCVLVNNAWVITINVSDTYISCSTAGAQMTVTGYAGNLTCPDPTEFCTVLAVNYCPFSCSGRGVCVAPLACACNSGWDQHSYCGVPKNASNCTQCSGGSCYGDTCWDQKETPNGGAIAGIVIGTLLGVIIIIILAVVIVKRIRRKKSRDIERKMPNNNEIGNKQANDASPNKQEGNNRNLIHTMNQRNIPNNQSPEQMVIQMDNLPLQDEAPVETVPRRSLVEDQIPQNLQFLEGLSQSIKSIKSVDNK